MALNTYENCGFERLCKWWLWTPMKMMALNAYENGGFKRLCKWWLWTPMKGKRMDQQQATFDHLQQRIDRIESRQESQYEEMMAYLRSVFPPPPPQPWDYLDIPLRFFFMLPKGEKFIGSRRSSYMSLLSLSYLSYCTCEVSIYIWNDIFIHCSFFVFYIASY